jgi:hypothetical protein
MDHFEAHEKKDTWDPCYVIYSNRFKFDASIFTIGTREILECLIIMSHPSGDI